MGKHLFLGAPACTWLWLTHHSFEEMFYRKVPQTFLEIATAAAVQTTPEEIKGEVVYTD